MQMSDLYPCVFLLRVRLLRVCLLLHRSVCGAPVLPAQLRPPCWFLPQWGRHGGALGVAGHAPSSRTREAAAGAAGVAGAGGRRTEGPTDTLTICPRVRIRYLHVSLETNHRRSY